MGSVESWRRAALAAYVLAGAALASGGYALATTQANVNAIAAAQQRLSDDGWSQHQAQVGHEEAVQRVAGAFGFGGVVADLGAFLAAVQGLDGGVDIEHPGAIQSWAH